MAGEEQAVPHQAAVIMLGFPPSFWQLTIITGTGYSIFPGFQSCFDINLSFFYCSVAIISPGISCFFLETTPGSFTTLAASLK